MIDLHFLLGLWIRNTWIYGNEEERVEALTKDLGEEKCIWKSNKDLCMGYRNQ